METNIQKYKWEQTYNCTRKGENNQKNKNRLNTYFNKVYLCNSGNDHKL